MATIQRALAELLPLADPLLVGVHRRWVDHELTRHAVRDAEEYAPGAIPGAWMALSSHKLRGLRAEVEIYRLDDHATGPAQIEFMKDAGMPLTTESRKTHTEVIAQERLAYMSLADFVPGPSGW